jgi:hypothetical protein
MNAQNYDHSVQAAERRAVEMLFPELQAHLNYANDVYNLAFVIQRSFAGRKLSAISRVAQAQFIILMRITDYLRSIQLLTAQGYPEQAGTLAASIFELAHTATSFSYAPDAAAAWLAADSINDQMPRKVLGKDWKRLVAANALQLGGAENSESEYQVYQQLCWMKHSLPKMQDMRVERDGVVLIFGPHTDERAINHAWFALQHAGRLTELVISLLSNDFGSDTALEGLTAAALTRVRLQTAAIERFGGENPFESAKVEGEL